MHVPFDRHRRSYFAYLFENKKASGLKLLYNQFAHPFNVATKDVCVTFAADSVNYALFLNHQNKKFKFSFGQLSWLKNDTRKRIKKSKSKTILFIEKLKPNKKTFFVRRRKQRLSRWAYLVVCALCNKQPQELQIIGCANRKDLHED